MKSKPVVLQEIFRRRNDFNGLSGERIVIGQPHRAQAELQLARLPAVKFVTHNRAARLRQVHADLMRPPGLEHELDQARDQLRIMTFERDELSRQAAAFDGIAVKTRERAVRAEAEHQKSAAALRELETWRAELERRLAATTTELGATKAGREADARELDRLREALPGQAG